MWLVKFPPIFDYVRYAIAHDDSLKIGIRLDGRPTFHRFRESFDYSSSSTHFLLRRPVKLVTKVAPRTFWLLQMVSWMRSLATFRRSGLQLGSSKVSIKDGRHCGSFQSFNVFYSHTQMIAQVISGMWVKYCKILPSDTINDDVQFVIFNSYPKSVFVVGWICMQTCVEDMYRHHITTLYISLLHISWISKMYVCTSDCIMYIMQCMHVSPNQQITHIVRNVWYM